MKETISNPDFDPIIQHCFVDPVIWENRKRINRDMYHNSEIFREFVKIEERLLKRLSRGSLDESDNVTLRHVSEPREEVEMDENQQPDSNAVVESGNFDGGDDMASAQVRRNDTHQGNDNVDVENNNLDEEEEDADDDKTIIYVKKG